MSGNKIIDGLREAIEVTKDPTRMTYRFVTPNGDATPWRRVPKNGVTGVQATRARKKFGKDVRVDLQLRSTPTPNGQKLK